MAYRPATKEQRDPLLSTLEKLVHAGFRVEAIAPGLFPEGKRRKEKPELAEIGKPPDVQPEPAEIGKPPEVQPEPAEI